MKPLNADERAATLAKSLSLADDAISAAEAECVQYVKAHALALKADVAFAEGRKGKMRRALRERHSALTLMKPNGRLALAESFISQGSPDEGIRVLEETRELSKAAAHVSFMLGQALMHRGTPSGPQEGIFDVFSTANLANLPRELVDPLTVGAVRALLRDGTLGKLRATSPGPKWRAHPSWSPR